MHLFVLSLAMTDYICGKYLNRRGVTVVSVTVNELIARYGGISGTNFALAEFLLESVKRVPPFQFRIGQIVKTVRGLVRSFASVGESKFIECPS